MTLVYFNDALVNFSGVAINLSFGNVSRTEPEIIIDLLLIPAGKLHGIYFRSLMVSI